MSKIYHRNGLIYLFKTSNLKKYNDFYGKKISPFIIENERSINIDNYQDLTYARAIAKKKLLALEKINISVKLYSELKKYFIIKK